MPGVKTSIVTDTRIRQWLEDASARTGIPMSTLVSMAVRKMQSDFAFFGVPIDYRDTVALQPEHGYKRRRPRRDLEKAG